MIRSQVVGIEAYTVEWNRPPGDRYDWDRWVDVGQVTPPLDSWDWALIVITTPVAYCTTLPPDPFVFRVNIRNPNAIHTWYYTKTGYFPARERTGDPMASFAPPRDNYGWAFCSPGPDRFWEFSRNGGDIDPLFPQWGTNHGHVIYYDASNGTIAMGDLFYFGSGGGFNPPPQPTR